MDRYAALAASPAGRAVLPRIGLPAPPTLRRHARGEPLTTGPVLLGGTAGGHLERALRAVLDDAGASVATTDDGDTRYGALVLDATGIATTDALTELHRFFSPVLRRLRPCGRVVVLGTRPAEADCAEEAVVQRALEGFTRSVGKEVGGRGSTSQLLRVGRGADGRLASPLRFLLSARSAFVSGQVVEVTTDVEGPDDVADWDAPLAGSVVAVTGASRGIGEAIAATAGRDGATVVAVDVPAAASALAEVARRTGGSYLPLDVTAPDAAARLARHVRDHHGHLDAVVHNAGITRDRRLVNLREDDWRQVIAVNLTAPLHITSELVADGLLGAGGRVVGVSSVAGIAGNNGQTNYATSKAGVIGIVDRLSGDLADRGITVNAVAPGFIETQMTATVPLAIREAGRRLSSLLQGGQPVDVAETVAWLAGPASSGVTGNVVRVCGQALIGA
ncbi:MAG: 3-oxoacyl-ACP reductase [Actinomycetes bacterium]